MNWKIITIIGFVLFGNFFVNCCGNGPAYRSEFKIISLEDVIINESKQGMDSLDRKDALELKFVFLDSLVNRIKISFNSPFSSQAYACSPKESHSVLLEGLKSLKILPAIKMNDEIIPGADISELFYFDVFSNIKNEYNLKRDSIAFQGIWKTQFYGHSPNLTVRIKNLEFVTNNSIQLIYKLEYLSGKEEEFLSKKYFIKK